MVFTVNGGGFVDDGSVGSPATRASGRASPAPSVWKA